MSNPTGCLALPAPLSCRCRYRECRSHNCALPHWEQLLQGGHLGTPGKSGRAAGYGCILELCRQLAWVMQIFLNRTLRARIPVRRQGLLINYDVRTCLPPTTDLLTADSFCLGLTKT